MKNPLKTCCLLSAAIAFLGEFLSISRGLSVPSSIVTPTPIRIITVINITQYHMLGALAVVWWFQCAYRCLRPC
jgi:hypothetical protein